MAGLHPLAVHFPIVLAFVWPVLDLVGLLTKRDDISRVALGILVTAVISSLFATVTGQAAFDLAIEAGISPELLNSHADDASLIPWLLLLVLVVRTVGVLKLGKRGHIAAIAAGFAACFLVYRAGETGGALVYRHGIGVDERPIAR
jgi:uncharacterized membrane protein